jgi:hypothetical protein
VSSCTFLKWDAFCRDALAIEGLEVDGMLDPLRESFLRTRASSAVIALLACS